MATVPTSRFPPGLWTADRRESHVGFSVGHATREVFRAWFESFEVRLDAGADGSASIRGTVAAGSIATAGGLFDAHLTSADLLDVARHPELTFASTFLQRDADLLEVDGMLTIRDRTLLVAGQGHVAEVAARRLDLDLTTVVDRRQFGLGWNPGRPGTDLAFGYEATIETRLTLFKEPT